MSDTTQPFVTFTLGCDPQIDVRITETETGTLFVALTPTDPTKPITDIDGLFFDLADDSTLSVDTLSNGAQVADQYDIGIQFGTTDSATSGTVEAANFTLFSDNGPMSLTDLDLDSFAVVVDSDGGSGQVLTSGDTPDADPVLPATWPTACVWKSRLTAATGFCWTNMRLTTPVLPLSVA